LKVVFSALIILVDSGWRYIPYSL